MSHRNKNDYEGVSEVIKNVPYIKSRWEKAFGNFEEALSIISKGIEENSKYEEGMECLQAERAMNDAMNKLQQHLTLTGLKVQDTYNNLLMLRAMNQADESADCSLSRKRTADGESKSHTSVPPNEKQNFENHAATLGGVCRASAELNKIFENIAALESFAKDKNGQQICDLNALTKVQKDRIKDLNSALQTAFNRATLIGDDIPETHNNDLSTLEKALIGTMYKKLKKIAMPGPTAAEVKCVQPFLLAILRSLGTVTEYVNNQEKMTKCEKGEPTETETLEKIVTINRTLASTSYRPRRVADSAIAADGNFYISSLR